MDKIAMVKSAEVRGVLACLIDNDLMKVANEEQFEAIADAVAENLGDDYTVEDVIAGTEAVVEAAKALEEMDEGELAALEAAVAEEKGEDVVVEPEEVKEASEVDRTALLAEYGELVMAKEAGEITDAYFEKKAWSLQGMLQGAKNTGSKLYKGNVNKDTIKGLHAAAKAKAGTIGAGAKEKAMSAGTSLKNTFTGKGITDAKALKVIPGDKRNAMYRKNQLLKAIGKTTGAYGLAGAGAGAGTYAGLKLTKKD